MRRVTRFIGPLLLLAALIAGGCTQQLYLTPIARAATVPTFILGLSIDGQTVNRLTFRPPPSWQLRGLMPIESGLHFFTPEFADVTLTAGATVSFGAPTTNAWLQREELRQHGATTTEISVADENRLAGFGYQQANDGRKRCGLHIWRASSDLMFTAHIEVLAFDPPQGCQQLLDSYRDVILRVTFE